MLIRATSAAKGDAARQESKDLRDENKNLRDQTERQLSSLMNDVSAKDQQISQLKTDLETSKTSKTSAERREEDLNSAARNLLRAADELGEKQWSGIIEALTGVRGQGTGPGGGDRATTTVSRQVNDLKRQVPEQQGRARELVSSLQRLGFDTSGIQGAVDKAPATALPSLIASLEAFVQQHTTESQIKERLLLDIQRAEAHCDREITDAVWRRVPLQFLARAREMLEQARTQVEVNAAVTIGDRIVDDIYRLYLPRVTR